MSTVSHELVHASRRALNVGSKSFASAARLFAPEERESATLLYAWCRYCDDVIDGQELGHGRVEAVDDPARRLAELAAKTRAALHGASTNDPPFAALQAVVRRHAIPHRYPMELLEGFAMDVEKRRYETLDEVLRYCYHVAGVVGLMMAHIMGVRDEAVLDRACDLGLALQLTNIARDVLDDAANGRVYLPLNWLAREHISPEAVTSPERRKSLVAVVGRLLDEADQYYQSADVGVRALPFRSAWSIAVARGVYSEIGQLVKRRGVDAWSTRAVVTKRKKLGWVVRGAARAMRARTFGRLMPQPHRDHLWQRPREWRPALQPVELSSI